MAAAVRVPLVPFQAELLWLAAAPGTMLEGGGGARGASEAEPAANRPATASTVASRRQYRRAAKASSCPSHAQGTASAELSHIDSPLLWPYNESFTIQSASAMKAQWQMVDGRKADRLCPGEAERELAHSGGGGAGRATCADDGRRLAAVGVRLLVGVLIDPSNCARREAIRKTWMRWPGIGTRSLVCFVIGRAGLSARLRDALDAEATQSGDILWLPRTTDGCYLSISKVHDWWRAAAALQRPAKDQPASLQHVAKVDDDSFLNLPRLETRLARVRCVPYLYYGGGGYAGYHPTQYRMCGFSWLGPRAYHRYGCRGNGAHPPVPFALGGLQVHALHRPVHRPVHTHRTLTAHSAHTLRTLCAHSRRDLGCNQRGPATKEDLGCRSSRWLWSGSSRRLLTSPPSSRTPTRASTTTRRG